MTSPFINTAIEHPWLTFALSWPTALVLVVACWLFAEVMTRGMNIILQLANLLSNTLVLCVRGYAPQSAEAHTNDDDTPTGIT